MKNRLLGMILIALMFMVSCKQATKEIETVTEEVTVEEEKPDYALFEKRADLVRAFIKAHCEENLEVMDNMLSDTLKWNPPMYTGDQWLGKDDILPILKSYHTDYENIKFAEGIGLPNGETEGGIWSGSAYPEATANSNPTALRVYGTWTAKHTESSKEIGVKWFGLYWIGDDDKIYMMTEYFDVHGLAAQIAD